MILNEEEVKEWLKLIGITKVLEVERAYLKAELIDLYEKEV